MSYPTSRTVGYSYGDSGTIDNRLSRVAAITDGGSNTFAAYTYLGSGTIINTAHPGVTGGLDLTLGTKDNGYSGLDRYGRIVDQIWRTVGENPAVLDEYRYGYDAASNRLWKENAVAHDLSTPVNLDELYNNDDLYRLLATDRGRLNSTQTALETGTQTANQDWTLDGLGNFSQFNDNGTTQDRTVNTANQITGITTGGTTTNPTYDAAGNLINDGTLKYTYDAWNRQVKVSTMIDETEQTVATYEFDGLNRRIEKTVYDLDTGDPIATTDYFYNENWQVLEERLVEGENDPVVTQYVWDISYVDSPVVRFRDGDADGTFEDAYETLYYTWDANHNITALVNPDGTVAERYVYDSYGKVTICDASWSPLTTGGTNTVTPGSSSAFANEILFCGYRYDAETALYTATVGATGSYQVRTRQYVTMLGVFDVPDPLGYAAGDGNLYRYVGNGPTNATDPTGLWRRLDYRLLSHVASWFLGRPHPVYSGYFIADKKDTFATLIDEVNRWRAQQNKRPLGLESQFSVVPAPDAAVLAHVATKQDMMTEWGKGRPAECGVYDASNLLDMSPLGNPIVVGVGTDDNGYIEATSAFWGITDRIDRHRDGAWLKKQIATNSGRGRTPIGSVVLIGHSSGDVNSIGSRDKGTQFTLNTLAASDKLVTKQVPWTKAVTGELPMIGWFRTDATIRFVGCETSNLAHNFASRYLRGDAIAYGTTTSVLPIPGANGQYQLAWATYVPRHIDVPGHPYRPTNQAGNKVGPWKWAPDHWKAESFPRIQGVAAAANAADFSNNTTYWDGWRRDE